MDRAQFLSSIVPSVVAVVAIVGAFLGAWVQARAAVRSVRRGHQRSAYADLVRATRAYLSETRGAVLAAAELDANCQPEVDPEDDHCLTPESVTRLQARITSDSTDTGKLLEAVTLVLLEGPKKLSTQAEKVAEASGELRSSLVEAGYPTENLDGSTEWPHPDRADKAHKRLNDELDRFMTMATKVINEK
jgi:Sec-independent protein translocase protein TatA